MSRVPVLHAVTDDRVVALADFLARARALALGPDVAIVLRTRLPGGPLLALADRLRLLTATTGTRLVVHDRLDVAELCGADGLHVPERGLPVAAARRALGPTSLLGRSIHAPDTARGTLADGADYVFLGPIWRTASHPDRAPLGTAALAAAGSVAAGVIAIGGVTVDRAAEARVAGARGVAAVTALWDAPDPAAAARALLLSFTA